MILSKNKYQNLVKRIEALEEALTPPENAIGFQTVEEDCVEDECGKKNENK
jgi:hypothetical protein